jgi:hypothetical protein
VLYQYITVTCKYIICKFYNKVCAHFISLKVRNFIIAIIETYVVAILKRYKYSTHYHHKICKLFKIVKIHDVKIMVFWDVTTCSLMDRYSNNILHEPAASIFRDPEI